ncbi:amidinotransferase [Pseudoalteromonas luteoviolacea]|nr:amidinotransferase [Pseudoalteromonas luteoviolacea]
MQPVVNSHNEWDPLEEVIVGRIDEMLIPEWSVCIESTMPEIGWDLYKEKGGTLFPEEMLYKAKEELDNFANILAGNGLTVVRPDSIQQNRPFSTPDWHAQGSLYSAMPRDGLIVFGDEIIEAPMCWRNRYYEAFPFRTLLKDYFNRGAKWTAAPKPELSDSLYVKDYQTPQSIEEMRYGITEFEPVFDAADFARCGRDIFAQQSNVTNEFGIEWLRRHLGSDYNVHVLEVNDTHPMHIDATFCPMAPGKVLVNPERIKHLPAMFKNWEILVAPEPTIDISNSFTMCSNWIVANTLMLNEKQVFVEAEDMNMVRALESWGFEPIPVSLLNLNRLGGGFHCCTLDVRRKGTLEAYF